jgi:hypothetical protein
MNSFLDGSRPIVVHALEEVDYPPLIGLERQANLLRHGCKAFWSGHIEGELEGCMRGLCAHSVLGSMDHLYKPKRRHFIKRNDLASGV